MLAPDRAPLLGRVVWKTMWHPVHLAGRLGWDLKLEYEAGVPDGPVVVAANHLSHIDVVLVGLAARRSMRFLAVDELYGQSATIDWLLAQFGAIPLTRTKVPLGAMRMALGHLAEGGAVGVFPEGRRVAHWGESPPKRGAAWLSRRSGAPLLPMAVVGTDAAWGLDEMRLRRAPVSVHIGRALDPREHDTSPDPVGSMTDAWASWVDGVLRASGGDRSEP